MKQRHSAEQSSWSLVPLSLEYGDTCSDASYAHLSFHAFQLMSDLQKVETIDDDGASSFCDSHELDSE